MTNGERIVDAVTYTNGSQITGRAHFSHVLTIREFTVYLMHFEK